MKTANTWNFGCWQVRRGRQTLLSRQQKSGMGPASAGDRCRSVTTSGFSRHAAVSAFWGRGGAGESCSLVFCVEWEFSSAGLLFLFSFHGSFVWFDSFSVSQQFEVSFFRCYSEVWSFFMDDELVVVMVVIGAVGGVSFTSPARFLRGHVSKGTSSRLLLQSNASSQLLPRLTHCWLRPFIRLQEPARLRLGISVLTLFYNVYNADTKPLFHNLHTVPIKYNIYNLHFNISNYPVGFQSMFHDGEVWGESKQYSQIPNLVITKL